MRTAEQLSKRVGLGVAFGTAALLILIIIGFWGPLKPIINDPTEKPAAAAAGARCCPGARACRRCPGARACRRGPGDPVNDPLQPPPRLRTATTMTRHLRVIRVTGDPDPHLQVPEIT